MAAVLVLRIPFWRTFVFEIPQRHQIIHDLTSLFHLKIRHKIFEEIEAGNDAAAILLADPKGLKRWRGEWEDSPLIAAIGHGRSELACELLEIGGTSRNDGALEIAAKKGDLIVVKALLEFGKNPDETVTKSDFHKGYTPLMWATNSNYILVMEALLTAGANVDAVAEDGTTAAMLTRKGAPKDIEALEVLCRYKPNITIKDWRKRNLVREALDLERNSSKPEMRLLLERYYPKAIFDTVNK